MAFIAVVFCESVGSPHRLQRNGLGPLWVSLPVIPLWGLLAIADVAHSGGLGDSGGCHKEDTQEPRLQRQHACSHLQDLKAKKHTPWERTFVEGLQCVLHIYIYIYAL